MTFSTSGPTLPVERTTSTDAPGRVLVAGAHPAMRLGIRRTLEEAGFDVCAEVANAADAVTGARTADPQVCLLDVDLPGGAIVAARRISDALPVAAVVILADGRHDDLLLAALRAGAVGFLARDMNVSRLADALAAVLRGEAALPRRLVMRVLDELHDGGRRHVRRHGGGTASLTRREWDILDGLREGLTTKHVAERLHISPATVRTHVHHILRKLGVHDRDSALRLLNGDAPGA